MSGAKGKDGSGEGAVLRYLSDQNRPYSVNDLLLNMKKEVGKAGIQKALDKLVQEEKVREKVYGKQKIYFVNQKDLGESSPQELKTMDSSIEQMEKASQEAEHTIKVRAMQLRDILSKLVTADASQKLELEESILLNLTAKQLNLASKVVWIDEKERQRVREGRANALKKCRVCKRFAKDMIDTILENWPKDKKTLLEDMKVETDEDAGVVLPLS